MGLAYVFKNCTVTPCFMTCLARTAKLWTAASLHFRIPSNHFVLTWTKKIHNSQKLWRSHEVFLYILTLLGFNLPIKKAVHNIAKNTSFHRYNDYSLVFIAIVSNFSWRQLESVSHFLNWFVSCVSSRDKITALILSISMSAEVILTRFLTQHWTTACLNSGILSAYITGFIIALEQLRKRARKEYLIDIIIPRYLRPDTKSKGSQQTKARMEANINVLVKRTFCVSLFCCCEATRLCLIFLQIAILKAQVIITTTIA